MITLDHVSKWYQSFQVLKDCSTEVAKGEVVVVCGPSGSGKSTLIKCVNGLEPFQEGSISVAGVPVGDRKTNLPKLRARIGMVFQHFELFPHLTVMANLVLAQVKVLGRGRAESEQRGMKLLERVGLREHAAKFSGQLSGGQQQRVAIARALAMDPIAMAVRRADLGAGPRNDQRGARCHGLARERRDDHDGGHARDGVCAQGGPARGVHGRGPHCRGRAHGPVLQSAAQRARADFSLQDPPALKLDAVGTPITRKSRRTLAPDSAFAKDQRNLLRGLCG